MKPFSLLIGGGIRDSQLVKPAGNGVFAHSLIDEPAEDGLDNIGGFWVGDQEILVVRRFLVAVRGECADKFAFPPLCGEGAADIQRGFCRIAVIHQAVDGDFQPAYGFRVEKAVYPGFADGDETGAFLGKYLFQKVALVGVIAEHPGQVFADNAVDDSGIQVSKHLQKGRAFIIGAALAVINVISGKEILSRKGGFQVFGNDFFLVGDAQAFVISIVPGEADVGAYAPNSAGGAGRGNEG